MPKAIVSPETHQPSGRLRIIAEVDRPIKSRKFRRRVLCRCDCGSTTEVALKDFHGEHIVSCGCYRLERLSLARTTHGRRHSPEYKSWAGMVQRCTNPNEEAWADYGGRGITVYAGWINDPGAFMDYVGPRPTRRHSIDRIDNSRGYEPGNVRWASRREQNTNRRNTIFVNHLGQDRPLIEVCEETGFPYRGVYQRWHRGVRGAALFAPLRRDIVRNIEISRQ